MSGGMKAVCEASAMSGGRSSDRVGGRGRDAGKGEYGRDSSSGSQSGRRITDDYALLSLPCVGVDPQLPGVGFLALAAASRPAG